MSDVLRERASTPRVPRRSPRDLHPVDGAALLAAAEAEADALADRLHDGALQALVVARYASDVVVRGGADPAVARDAVQDALVALRRVVWQLRPRADDLVASLRALSAQRVAAGGAPLDLGDDACLPALGLGPAGAALAYRLVQAASQEPGPVRVRLTSTGRRVVLSVTGGALDPAVWTARARAVGGAFHTSPPGRPPGRPPVRTARLLLPVGAAPDAAAPDAADPDVARPDPEGAR